VPLNDRGWQRAEEGRTGHQFFYEVGNDSDRNARPSANDDVDLWRSPLSFNVSLRARILWSYDTASNPTRRVARIANDGALNWAKKIKDFERLRFERLYA
jgi:hypothetical protein